MAVFDKDEDGRITIHCGGEVKPNAQGEDVAGRNMSGRVFLKGDKPFEVIVRSDGVEMIVCSGTSSATAGKMCSLYIRVRGEADVDEPAPIPEAGDGE